MQPKQIWVIDSNKVTYTLHTFFLNNNNLNGRKEKWKKLKFNYFLSISQLKFNGMNALAHQMATFHGMERKIEKTKEEIPDGNVLHNIQLCDHLSRKLK